MSKSERAKKQKRFYLAPLFWLLLVWFAFNWSWIEFTDGVTLAGSALTGRLLATLGLIVITLLSATIMWQAFRLADRLAMRHKPWQTLLMSTALFAFADVVVSWASLAPWYGPQGRLDSVCPLASPALLLMHTPLAYAARLIGLYGLSAMVWTSIFIICQPKLRRLLPLYLVGVASLAVIAWGAYHDTNGQPLKVKIVNETLENRQPAIEPSDAQLVVFPEYGWDKVPDNDPSSRLLPSTQGPASFISSRQVFRSNGLDGHYNQRVFGDAKSGITDVQDKYRLIPGGEDLSYTVRVIMLATHQRAALDYFTSMRGVVTGDHQLRPLYMGDGAVVGSAICSSIISPEDYRSLTRQGSTILTNSASLDIFEGSPVFAWQQKSLGQFMAIANARPFVQSVNSAHAFALDASGHTIIQLNQPGVADATVRLNKRRTLYTLIGEWPAMLGAGLVLVLVGKSLYCRVWLKKKARK